MQELTSQYNWIKTRKFEISYTDFQPDATAQKSIFLRYEKSRSMLIYFYIKHTQIFSGSGITTVNLYLYDQLILSVPLAQLTPFCSLCVSDAVSNTTGTQGAPPERIRSDLSPAQKIILAYDTITPGIGNIKIGSTFIISNTARIPAEIYLTLKLNTGGSLNNLTSGQAIIYYTLLRMK